MSTIGLARFGPSGVERREHVLLSGKHRESGKEAVRTPESDKFLDGLEPEEFAEKAAHFLSELNVIHAFREGNGRSQMAFFLLLTDHAGHPINLENFDPDTFLNAMIASFEGDEEPLAAVIQVLVGTRRTRSDIVSPPVPRRLEALPEA